MHYALSAVHVASAPDSIGARSERCPLTSDLKGDPRAIHRKERNKQKVGAWLWSLARIGGRENPLGKGQGGGGATTTVGIDCPGIFRAVADPREGGALGAVL